MTQNATLVGFIIESVCTKSNSLQTKRKAAPCATFQALFCLAVLQEATSITRIVVHLSESDLNRVSSI